eukprot:640495-Pyramimonas_sp.AAC.1
MGPRSAALRGGNANGSTGAVGGSLFWATKRCAGWGETHAGCSIEACGGPPNRATKRCTAW